MSEKGVFEPGAAGVKQGKTEIATFDREHSYRQEKSKIQVQYRTLGSAMKTGCCCGAWRRKFDRNEKEEF